MSPSIQTLNHLVTLRMLLDFPSAWLQKSDKGLRPRIRQQLDQVIVNLGKVKPDLIACALELETIAQQARGHLLGTNCAKLEQSAFHLREWVDVLRLKKRNELEKR